MLEISCSPENPCGSCAALIRHPYYEGSVGLVDRTLFHEWLFADQGCDMSWPEYRAWGCPICTSLRAEIYDHQYKGRNHEQSP